MKKIEVLFLFVFCTSAFLKGQSVDLMLISSAGGVMESKETSMSFALGELAIQTFKTQDLFLTQGFLQPSSKINNAIQQNEQITNLQMYPNPASDLVNLEMDMDAWFVYGVDLQVELMDLNGKTIRQESFDQPMFQLNINQLMSGMYYIVVRNVREEYRKVFVLQKIKN